MGNGKEARDGEGGECKGKGELERPKRGEKGIAIEERYNKENKK